MISWFKGGMVQLVSKSTCKSHRCWSQENEVRSQWFLVRDRIWSWILVDWFMRIAIVIWCDMMRYDAIRCDMVVSMNSLLKCIASEHQLFLFLFICELLFIAPWLPWRNLGAINGISETIRAVSLPGILSSPLPCLRPFGHPGVAELTVFDAQRMILWCIKEHQIWP